MQFMNLQENFKYNSTMIITNTFYLHKVEPLPLLKPPIMF